MRCVSLGHAGLDFLGDRPDPPTLGEAGKQDGGEPASSTIPPENPQPLPSHGRLRGALAISAGAMLQRRQCRRWRQTPPSCTKFNGCSGPGELTGRIVTAWRARHALGLAVDAGAVAAATGGFLTSPGELICWWGPKTGHLHHAIGPAACSVAEDACALSSVWRLSVAIMSVGWRRVNSWRNRAGRCH
jgi:hypothetical protein